MAPSTIAVYDIGGILCHAVSKVCSWSKGVDYCAIYSVMVGLFSSL